MRELRTLTAGELRALLDAVAERHPAWLAPVSVLASTGLRAGELHALTWADWRPDQLALEIRRAVWRGHVGETKTSRPRRIGIPVEVAGVIEAHRPPDATPGGLIFPSTVGTPRTPAALAKVLREAATVAGLGQRVTPQVLRRTVNTLLVESGAPLPVLRSILGHVTERMTMHYSGIHDEAQRAALGRHVLACSACLDWRCGPGARLRRAYPPQDAERACS